MRTFQPSLVFALLALAACTGDGDKPYKPGPDSEPGDDAEVLEPEADTEPTPEPDSDAPGSGPVPFSAWVDDMIDKRTDDDSPPDTVHDKYVTDDMDPTAFTKYLN